MRVWYGLNNGEIEEQVNERFSFSRFAGPSMDDEVPDSTALCRFRGTLARSGVYDRLLPEVNRRLESRHVVVTSGVIVDAGVTDSPRRPRGQREYEVVRDWHEEEGVDTANARLVEKPRAGVDTEDRRIVGVKIESHSLRHTADKQYTSGNHASTSQNG